MIWIGYLAGLCTTIAYIPQLIHTYKQKSAKNISLGMYSLSAFGICCWLMYGIQLQSKALIIANSISLTFVITIITMKIVFDYIMKNKAQP